MFYGRYYHTVDEKGRVSLPAKFRELDKKWVVTRGLDGGLFLFRAQDFAQEIDKIAHLEFTKKSNRDFVRLMTNDALEVETDNLGRILLNEALRAAVQLTKNVCIVGSLQRIEIWPVEKYHQYIDEVVEKAESISEQVSV